MNNRNATQALPGHFYAVGVGPGSSDLLTLRAVDMVRSADVIIAPRSRIADVSLALQAVKYLLDGQGVIDHVYTMARDAENTIQSWAKMAELVNGEELPGARNEGGDITGADHGPGDRGVSQIEPETAS